MAESITHDLELPGCTPEPLMAYLKALGILRLVSEQADRAARGWWRNDTFRLWCPGLFKDADSTAAKREALAKFFLTEYKPTPIVVPWSGGDFFDVNWQPQSVTAKKTPTASRAIEAILATTTSRFDAYRNALQACRAALDNCEIDTKEKMGKQKWDFIQTFRSTCAEPGAIEWIDAAAVNTVERFSALLGSGGGSDGNTHFSDNFMQNLWDVLPDFDTQRYANQGQRSSVADSSMRQLAGALFGIPSKDRIAKRTSSLFDSGAVGGPNATQGMERESMSNPWDVILALEGTVSFAGAATKRLGANAAVEGAFPFQVSASATAQDGLTDKECAGSELWLPLWTQPARSDEVHALMREGRAQCGLRSARSGVDMSRAIASLGVDRGVLAFGRYAILKGRVGGENYNTAASLGQFHVVERTDVELLSEVDSWLEQFRRAAGDKNAPPRFGSALRAIDSAVFNFCRYGGKSQFQEIVIALGQAERELALTPGKVGQSKFPPGPLAGLSQKWIAAANDGSPAADDGSPAADDVSPEFAIARALAGIDDSQHKLGPLRANLEPVATWYDSDKERTAAKWAEKDRAVVWNAADLPTNLVAVLARRMMDGDRKGCEHLPLDSPAPARLSDIACFIAGDLDDRRIEDLLWGLMLVEPGRCDPRESQHAGDIPAAYALLKLLFLPRPLVIEQSADSAVIARLLRENEEGGVIIRPEPSILHLLRARGLGEACRIAMRRLRASGLDPMPKPIRGHRVRDGDWAELDGMGDAAIDRLRLAASLLIPIDDSAVNRIVRLVIRGDDFENLEQ